MGAIGILVDDLPILGRKTRFVEKIGELQRLQSFGALKSGSQTFTKVEIGQSADGTVFRGVIGALLWLSVQTRPDLAF